MLGRKQGLFLGGKDKLAEEITHQLCLEGAVEWRIGEKNREENILQKAPES